MDIAASRIRPRKRRYALPQAVMVADAAIHEKQMRFAIVPSGVVLS